MSYDLDLHFKPAISRDRLLKHFAAHRHFSIKNDDVLYKNEDTGVYFFMRLRAAKYSIFRRTVISAEFEINYCRPSYFGIEAEMELSTFMTTFQPRIEDPQMHGMGEGPYSREGFLRGWNFGNVFCVQGGVSRKHSFESMPADELRAAWEWNYNLAERRRDTSLFVPMMSFFRIEGRPRRVIVWGEGMPALLPRVDHVLVGRIVSGERRFGLAPWSEVVDLAKRAGFDTTTNPLKLAYLVTPPPIADWVANRPLIDFDALERLSADEVLDEELIAEARDLQTKVAADDSDAQ